MPITLSQFQQWIDSRENGHLEFKEVRNSFSFDKLVQYCAALANERGRMIIFGVTNRTPRQAVSSAGHAAAKKGRSGCIVFN